MSPLRATLACGAFALPSSGFWTPYARTHTKATFQPHWDRPGLGREWAPPSPSLANTLLDSLGSSNPPPPTRLYLPTIWPLPGEGLHPTRPPALCTPCARLPGAGQSARPGPRHWVLSGHSLSLSQSASPAPPQGVGPP